MLVWWRNFKHALLYDEQAFRRWMAGLVGLFTGAFTGAITDMLKYGPEAVLGWSKKQMAAHFALSFVTGVVAMVSPTRPTQSSTQSKEKSNG